MSQVSSARRARERRAAMTDEQIEAHRAKMRAQYHRTKATGKKRTRIPFVSGWN